MINIQYETFLRKDIFRNSPDYVDEIIDVYEQDPEKRRYISYVLESYIQGKISHIQAYKWLVRNVYFVSKRIKENTEYLDKEYEEKMKGGDQCR